MRLNKKGELWSHIAQVQVLRDATGTFGNTTLSADTAVAAGTLPVAAITNFAVGEIIRVGRDEETEVVRIHPSTAPASGNITLATTTPTRVAHRTGDPVVELTATDPGHVDDGGLNVELTGTEEDVFSATQRLLLGRLPGSVGITISFGLLGFNVENLALALGMRESRIVGAGTVASPRTLNVLGDRVKEESDIGFLFTGARKDGGTCRITAMACEPVLDVQFAIARGRKVFIPVRAKVTGGLLYEQWN